MESPLKKHWLLVALLIIPVVTFAQQNIALSLFNNATLLPPRSLVAVANQPIHPGVSVGFERALKKSHLLHTVQLGLFHHKYVHNGVQIYTELGKRWDFLEHFWWEARIGAGYLHTFTLNDQASLDANGKYELDKKTGRPQFMFGPTVRLGYFPDLENGRIGFFVNYHVWMQTPFVKSYVPLLPNGSLHVGVLIRKKKNE